MSKQRPSFRTEVAVWAGMATSALSRKLGRGEGSVIGGRVSLLIDPKSLEVLSVGKNIVLVSATNGKTTTTSMLAAALETAGEVVTNAAGANMFGGIVGALSASSAPTAVLEIDESHLPAALVKTAASFLLLLNLSRDQLDRVGEVRMQAQKWRMAIAASSVTVIANADDPLVVWASQVARKTVWVAAGNTWRFDAASCPACGERIDWADEIWACSSCDLRRPEPNPPTEVIIPDTLRIPGDVNRRNAAMALTAAVLMGADPDKAARAVRENEGPGGRFTSVTVGAEHAHLILAKNPAGWTEALRLLRPSPAPLVAAINARVQDGRDPSWLWDVPYEQLQGRFVVATGDRGRDLAVRLRYANVEHVFERNPVSAVAIAAARSNHEEVDVVANYSAFQDFRKVAQ